MEAEKSSKRWPLYTDTRRLTTDYQPTAYWCSAVPRDTSPKRPDPVNFSMGTTESYIERSGQGVKLTPKSYLALLRHTQVQLYDI